MPFDDKYQSLLRVASIFSEAGISIEMRADVRSIDLLLILSSLQPVTVVQLLVGRGSFELARIFATANNIGTDAITVSEAEAKLTESAASSLWLSPDTRVAIWNECSKLFKKHDCSNAAAGQYFVDKAENVTPLTPPLAPKEVVALLVLALKWFDGSINHGDPAKDPAFLEVTSFSIDQSMTHYFRRSRTGCG